MKNERSKLGLVLMTLVMLLVLGLGPVAPGAAGLSGRAVLCYYDGGGSDGG